MPHARMLRFALAKIDSSRSVDSQGRILAYDDYYDITRTGPFVFPPSTIGVALLLTC
jgi:hypothetical protein